MTIWQFQGNNKHEFNNVGADNSNIAGIYQWVNKISQFQLYNYGKRLLTDIVNPEPAAFLMTQADDDGPTLPKPDENTYTA